jgi:hypothetical protein
MRMFLPLTDEQQRAEFVGTMTGFLVESEDATLMYHYCNFNEPGRLVAKKIRVAGSKPAEQVGIVTDLTQLLQKL